jgi:RNA polymerase sigma-70 factor, ECF subfamily
MQISQSAVDARGPAASSPSDEALMFSMAAGNKDALKILYLRHHVRVYRFLLRMLDEASAEEVLNEVFLDAWRRADRFEARCQVATWLMAIARFKAITHSRRRTEAQLDETVAAAIKDPSDNPVTALVKGERSNIIQDCLAKLTQNHREVINLIYYRGKKIEEVARSVGVPVNTIKTRLHHARNRMAQLLAEAGIDRTWAAI